MKLSDAVRLSHDHWQPYKSKAEDKAPVLILLMVMGLSFFLGMLAGLDWAAHP